MQVGTNFERVTLITEKNMKIAKFKSIEFGHIVIDGEEFDDAESYVRITEYSDVEFTPRDNADVVEKKVASLKGKKKRVMAEFELKLTEIDTKIGNLLALPQG